MKKDKIYWERGKNNEKKNGKKYYGRKNERKWENEN